MSTELAVAEQQTALSVEGVLNRLGAVQELMRRAMEKGVDYGVIPGTQSKPTLLKPGAEKLNLMFRFSEKFKTQKIYHPDGHLTVETTCEILAHDGTFLGDSSAMCSTREAKYAWRKAERVCPSCGKPAIIKGKKEYGGGWLCWKKKDGCGNQFADNDARITGQETARVQNPDIADSFNTVLRIAEKRAFIAAVRLVTGCSSIFDEEMPAAEPDAPEAAPETAKAEPQEYERIHANDVQTIRERMAKLEVVESLGVKWASKGRTEVLEDLTPQEGTFLWDAYKPKQPKPQPAEAPAA